MAFDIFLKIDGIDGGAQSAKFIKWITLDSFSWGATQVVSNNSDGVAEGKPQAGALKVAGPVQQSSPQLMLACAIGSHFKKVQLVVINSRNNTAPFMKFDLEDVLVSSYEINGGASTNQMPADSFSLNFAKLTESFAPQNRDGSLGAEVRAGFDFNSFVKF
jgi:type VI secretion system secreted protein Hcp